MPEVNAREWVEFLREYPDTHILQSAEWGELKSSFGWRVTRLVTGERGAQVLFRRLPFGLSVAYLPKGPVGGNWERLLPEVDSACRRQRAMFMIWEPDGWQMDPQSPGAGSLSPGFRRGLTSIQPPRTLVVDITGEEHEVLSRMKQKTRYNVRLASKRGVTVRSLADIDVFYRLVLTTGQRDRFGVHSRAYYQRAYELFKGASRCELLVAEYQEEALAGLMVFAYGKRAWYFYGGSGEEHRDLMPNYLLQWEAIRWARSQGCSEYDLWGVPDHEEDTLEAEFTTRSDGLWGVYRFKRGFGGVLRRSEEPQDRVYNPTLYAAYRWWVARRNA